MFGKGMIVLMGCSLCVSVMSVMLAPYGVRMCYVKCMQISRCHVRFLPENLTCVVDGVCKLSPSSTVYIQATNELAIAPAKKVNDSDIVVRKENQPVNKKAADCAVRKGKMLFYQGTMNITRTGLTCQRWDQQYPHRHHNDETSCFLSGETVTEASNYCRNIRDESAIPWCYTTSRKVRWQFCQVQVCDASGDERMDCATLQSIHRREIEDAIIYRGTRNTTVSGLACQRWDKQFPHKHHVDFKDFRTGESFDELANYCRTFPLSLQLPWCFTTNPKVRREICVTATCP